MWLIGTNLNWAERMSASRCESNTSPNDAPEQMPGTPPSPLCRLRVGPTINPAELVIRGFAGSVDASRPADRRISVAADNQPLPPDPVPTSLFVTVTNRPMWPGLSLRRLVGSLSSTFDTARRIRGLAASAAARPTGTLVGALPPSLAPGRRFAADRSSPGRSPAALQEELFVTVTNEPDKSTSHVARIQQR